MKTDLFVNPYEWIEAVDDKTIENYELDDLLYDISIKIFDYRIKHGINQKQLAELLNVSQSMVSKLESGEYNPTIEQLWKISKKLNLRFEILLTEYEMDEKSNEIWNRKRKVEIVSDKDNSDEKVGMLAC